MDEQSWIRKLEGRFGLEPSPDTIGIGDDAALLPLPPGEGAVLTTDSLVEGVHFEPDWLDDAELGERLVAVSLSDLAAMGARPAGLLLAVETAELPGRVGDEFWDGVAGITERHSVPLLGGNVTRTSGPLTLTSFAIGAVVPARALRRSGARGGDDIWVSGTPGRAGWARRRLRENARDPAARAAWRAVPRCELGCALAERAGVTAAIDLSDGLGLDVSRLLHASRVGGHLNLDPLVRSAEITVDDIIEGGEDYELAFTAPPAGAAEIEKLAEELNLPLTRIGRALEAASAGAPGRPAVRWELEGRDLEYHPRGWDPFR